MPSYCVTHMQYLPLFLYAESLSCKKRKTSPKPQAVSTSNWSWRGNLSFGRATVRHLCFLFWRKNTKKNERLVNCQSSLAIPYIFECCVWSTIKSWDETLPSCVYKFLKATSLFQSKIYSYFIVLIHLIAARASLCVIDIRYNAINLPVKIYEVPY